MEDSSLFPDNRLCGFLPAVLTVNSLHLNIKETLPFNTRCYIFKDGSEIGFRSQNGIVLSPMDDDDVSLSGGDKKKRRRLRSMGSVKGSISVVHQLYWLVKHKCLTIDARVIRLAVLESEEVRVVVLVDVYLPTAVWSGRKFPKSSIAGALFRHLSCDWGHRRSMLVDGGEYLSDSHDSLAWKFCDCHVLDCKLHCGYNALDSSKNRLFELHEVFMSLPRPTPSVSNKGKHPSGNSCSSGILKLPDDILINILVRLDPMDLDRVAVTCRHLESLADLALPPLKLKLFPHQEGAVEWMLQREQNSTAFRHPLYKEFLTEDRFSFSVNIVSGDIVTGPFPTIRDFRGGMLCDEPGLGKTITALSLILRTQGKMPDPPDGAQIIWCRHNGDPRCGYYDLSGRKRFTSEDACRGQLSLNKSTPMKDSKYSLRKRARLMDPGEETKECGSFRGTGMKIPSAATSAPQTQLVVSTRSSARIRKKVFHMYDIETSFCKDNKGKRNSTTRKRDVESSFCKDSKSKRNSTTRKRAKDSGPVSQGNQPGSIVVSNSCKRPKKAAVDKFVLNDNWAQCDLCGKWRKTVVADATAAWFCSMNNDPTHQSCIDPEEAWDRCESVTYLQGFHTKRTSGGKKENVSFFISVLKEHHALMNSETKKALTWLAELSPGKLSEMETFGLISPVLGTYAQGFGKICQSFGLISRVEKGISRWYYPPTLEKLAFDSAALRSALSRPLDSIRLYLSRATLVVVPSYLVDHWKTQIEKHVRPGLLRLFVWTDRKKLSAHSLAWDYDIVITTFNRLTAEWGRSKKSPMGQVHWYRVMLDEGHTLGSSLDMTNKFQMAVSLTASNRWLLTGTPAPNTPNSQLSHFQPMLKFLHEEAYGQDQKSWEAGILRPFEAEMEEGRSRLLKLLHRCMICAKKIDLQTVPPCIKAVTFLNFTEVHARSYNELVVTVRRNILMADWNDPSHVESLLNPKQWKFRNDTIRNVRLSCCVAGHIKLTDTDHDIQETMDVLVKNGLDATSEEYTLIKYNLLHGGNCLRCKEWCRLPVITPCRHLLCLDCVALDSERCTYHGCGNLYKMETSVVTRPENPNPKWPVPKDLIELQPSYWQDGWNSDWESTSSSKVTYLVEKLKALQVANRAMDSHMDVDNGVKALPEKVIIFSQFLEHINAIEQQLTVAGVKFCGMYSPLHAYKKKKSMDMFQHDASCLALLIDGKAALGLDFSFVNHVFLMEPIWDRSLEEQVISRAHRMGGTRPIHVETLAMHGTIEEQMMEFLQDSDKCKRFVTEDSDKTDLEGTQFHCSLHDFAASNYLAKLSFVRTNS